MTTRRGLIKGAAGALAAASAPGLVNAERAASAGSIAATAKVVRRGRSIAIAPRSGLIIVAHDARRTVAVGSGRRKRLVDVGGAPLELAASPNGRLAAVTTAAWDEPGLAIIDLESGKLVKRLEAGTAPFGVAFSADGRRIVVAGGEDTGEVRVFDAKALRQLARGKLGVCPRNAVPAPGAEGAWVVLNGSGRVVLVDERGKVKRSISTPALPDRLAVSADGKRLLVSHAGPKSDRVSEIEVRTGKARRHKAGRQPSGVAWAKGGRPVIALGGAGRVVVIDRGRRKRHDVGGSPRGLAVVRNRAWTVDALTGRISKVRL